MYELGFSPKASFVITWERPAKDAEGNATKNLKVWRLVKVDDRSSGLSGDQHTVVGEFVQKSQTGWNLQYTSDELYCARVVTNEIQFYEAGNLRTVWNKLRVERISDFALSPGDKDKHSVAAFIPERKVRPLKVPMGYTC